MKFFRIIEKPKGLWETKKTHFFLKFLQHKTEADLEPAKFVLRPLCYTFSTGFFYMIFHREHYELLKRFLKKVQQITLTRINVEKYLHNVALSS